MTKKEEVEGGKEEEELGGASLLDFLVGSWVVLEAFRDKQTNKVTIYLPPPLCNSLFTLYYSPWMKCCFHFAMS